MCICGAMNWRGEVEPFQESEISVVWVRKWKEFSSSGKDLIWRQRSCSRGRLASPFALAFSFLLSLKQFHSPYFIEEISTPNTSDWSANQDWATFHRDQREEQILSWPLLDWIERFYNQFWLVSQFWIMSYHISLVRQREPTCHSQRSRWGWKN